MFVFPGYLQVYYNYSCLLVAALFVALIALNDASCNLLLLLAVAVTTTATVAVPDVAISVGAMCKFNELIKILFGMRRRRLRRHLFVCASGMTSACITLTVAGGHAHWWELQYAQPTEIYIDIYIYIFFVCWLFLPAMDVMLFQGWALHRFMIVFIVHVGWRDQYCCRQWNIFSIKHLLA